MKKWRAPQPITTPDALRVAVGGHPLVAAHLARRGIATPQDAARFLNSEAYQPASPHELPDMDRAVERLRKAIRDKETILVWGDFDVDGQTSTALLVSALHDLGANVRYHIPNRFNEGHGIHLPTLKTLLDGISVLLTCDTGISAHESVDYAMRRGVDVVITDHHSLPPTLPEAWAIVNPMRLRDGHALRELPGVGTAYKLIQALYGATSSDHLLDLVALGIVADVMVQVDDTRYLLQRGLEVLRNDPRPGLREIMRRAEINPADLNETDIGFALGPRLNALGRLADANPAVELLTTDDSYVIAERVTQLEGLNQKRKFLTRQVYEAAQQQIKQDESLLRYAALVVAGEGWHTGVVGIVASRLVEDYGRPVLVLSENGETVRGSARSVAGVNIVEAIRAHGEMLHGFGGHNMAAGLSLNADDLFAFRRALSQTVREMGAEADAQPPLQIDAEVQLSEIDLDFAQDIGRLAPFGNGNPPLTLMTRDVEVKSRRTLGSRGDHIALNLVDGNETQRRVLWWFGDMDAVPQGRFDIAYTVRENTFNGKREALMEWLDARPAEGSIAVDEKPTYELIDQRQHSDVVALQAELRAAYSDALWFYEGPDKAIAGTHRYALDTAETLVVWSIPAGLTEWRAIVSAVQPQRIVLIGAERPASQSKALVQTVAGMAKFAQRERAGIIALDDLAKRTGQRAQTLYAAIAWLNTNTALQWREIDDDVWELVTGQPSGSDKGAKLAALLRETKAYGDFWLKTQRPI